MAKQTANTRAIFRNSMNALLSMHHPTLLLWPQCAILAAALASAEGCGVVKDHVPPAPHAVRVRHLPRSALLRGRGKKKMRTIPLPRCTSPLAFFVRGCCAVALLSSLSPEATAEGTLTQERRHALGLFDGRHGRFVHVRRRFVFAVARNF